MVGPPASPAFVALVQATAGAAGGVLASAALQPLEVAKTRIQVSGSGDVSTFATIQQILADESLGLAALFSGLSAKCSETGAKNFVYFYVYDALNTIAKRTAKVTTSGKMALGYFAGVVTTTTTMPLEVVSTQLQARGEHGEGTISKLRSILEQEGLHGLFRGFWFNILLCINPAIQNTCFDKMKAAVLKLKARSAAGRRAVLSPLQAFTLGALAKAVATVLTFPMVRAKTIIQVGSNVTAPDTHNGHSGANLDKDQLQDGKHGFGFQQLFLHIGQLYRGLGSALWKSVLQAALLYMTKDQVEQLVVRIFKLSVKMILRRRGGGFKLGALSGRPLAS